MAPPSLHVIVFPWSDFSHMIPFLQISMALAKSSVRVTYISTPRNIARLPPIPSPISNLLNYLELQLPKLKQLPQGAEATIDLTIDQIQFLKVAYDLLEQPFSQIIANHSPDWIIADFASYWAPKIATNHGVPLMLFSLYTAASRCFLGPKEYLVGQGRIDVRPNPESLMGKPMWIPFESSVFFRADEATRFHARVYTPNTSGISDGERLAKVLEGCQAVTIRSCREFEGEYLELYEKIIERPVIPAGLILPDENRLSDEARKGLDWEWSEVFEWLDEQSCKSVVFVGFGNEYELTKENAHEIAYGLELANVPFIWALRRPSWASDDSDSLPKGFQDQTSGRVCFGWVPQQEIMVHPSIGACLFQCGWGSVIETLRYGHSVVALPFIIDEGLNAKLLVDKELAVEVERSEDGLFSREEVARALRRAMVEEEGRKMRACARNVAKVFGDAKLHQECYIGGLVDYMRNNTKRRPSI